MYRTQGLTMRGGCGWGKTRRWFPSISQALLFSPSSENSAALSDLILSRAISTSEWESFHHLSQDKTRPFPSSVDPQQSKARHLSVRHGSAKHSRCLLTKYLLLASRDEEVWS